MDTQKNLGADDFSDATNARREAQCAWAAASMSAGRYGCIASGPGPSVQAADYTGGAPLTLTKARERTWQRGPGSQKDPPQYSESSASEYASLLRCRAT